MTTPVAMDPVSDRALRRRLHLRLAAQNGIVFAVLLGVYALTWSGAVSWDDRLRVFGINAVSGLLFGIFMSVILGSGHWQAVVAARDRRLVADPTASPIPEVGVRITKTVLVPLPAGEILSRAGGAATVLQRARVREIDQAAATVTLTTSITWQSWGERIVLAAGPDELGNTAVTITSRPRLRGTLVDYGRNATNVEDVGGWLRGLSR